MLHTPRVHARAVTGAATLALLATAAVATAPSSVADVAQGSRLTANQAVTSSANGYRLVMQPDGNLVQYRDGGVPLWSTGTAGRGASSMVLQPDGNLVVYTTAGSPTWWSGTTTASRLAVQDDGNLVLYDRASRPVWCSCSIPFQRVTGRPASFGAGAGMLTGDALAAGSRTLNLQSDGNLVVYGPSGATWAASTYGGTGSTVMLQGDGNLVVYGGGRALWASGTTTARTVRLGTDGNLVLLDGGNAPVWTSNAGNVTPSGIAGDVFAQLNRQRAENGLPALTSDPRLVASASAHNSAMSSANTLSHQLPGEASLGDRVTAAGYTWRVCAENIAWTTQTSSAGAQAMQTAMYNETPPDDGHRRNILSTSVTQVGVAVLIDSRGKLWLTTDFGAPR